jgi:hypothetical protein
MNSGSTRQRRYAILVAVVCLLLAGGARAFAQQRGGGAGGRGGAAAAAPTPKSDAAIDLTGTWVSVISEDWAWRMITPKKGDYTRVPLTPAARKIADSWDPAKDTAAGDQCKAYGVGGNFRLPGYLRISWQDDNTLKMEMTSGTQTRTLNFRPAAAPPEPSLQGYSLAAWQYTRNPPRSGELKVETSRVRPGYLRKNGVPYSANMTMTEYFHRFTAPNNDIWLTIVTEIKDPENLRDPFVQSTHFKKMPDTTAFKPEACEAQ